MWRHPPKTASAKPSAGGIPPGNLRIASLRANNNLYANWRTWRLITSVPPITPSGSPAVRRATSEPLKCTSKPSLRTAPSPTWPPNHAYMPHFPHHPKPRRLPSRRGLTLAELMLASAVMAVMSLWLATLVAGVRETSDYTQDQGSAVQHGRTAVARIERALRLAHASESFPGAMIVDEVVSSASLPHALAAWSPNEFASQSHRFAVGAGNFALCAQQ